VHLHDNELFGSLMAWIKDILNFLRQGPQGGALDMNALLHGAKDVGRIDKDKALEKINALINGIGIGNAGTRTRHARRWRQKEPRTKYSQVARPSREVALVSMRHVHLYSL
jgi:hypothetical protein